MIDLIESEPKVKDEIRYIHPGSLTRSTEIFDFVVLLSLLGSESEPKVRMNLVTSEKA